MKTFKVTALVWIIIYIIGAAFLYLRKTDGAGVVNSTANQIVSLIIWSLLFLIILVIYIIWYFQIKHK